MVTADAGLMQIQSGEGAVVQLCRNCAAGRTAVVRGRCGAGQRWKISLREKPGEPEEVVWCCDKTQWEEGRWDGWGIRARESGFMRQPRRRVENEVGSRQLWIFRPPSLAKLRCLEFLQHHFSQSGHGDFLM